jgi:hypothetical protein
MPVFAFSDIHWVFGIHPPEIAEDFTSQLFKALPFALGELVHLA